MGKVEEMVPSMHEEIVLNYNIEEYLYIKVLVVLLSNLLTIYV